MTPEEIMVPEDTSAPFSEEGRETDTMGHDIHEVHQPLLPVGLADPSEQKKRYLDTRRNWIAFFLLGWMNNMSYVVVLAGAQSLADHFGQGALIGVLAWADVGFGTFARILNAVYIDEWPVHMRMKLTVGVFVLGLVGVGVSQYINFWVSVIAICLIGGSCALGESCALIYLQNYPVSCTGAWSSGTGMAGVGGTLIYLALSSLHLGDAAIFFIMVPTALVHFSAFHFILVHPNEEAEGECVAGFQRFSDTNSVTLVDCEAVPQSPTSESVRNSEEREKSVTLDDVVTAHSSAELRLTEVVRGEGGGGEEGQAEETTMERVRRVNSLVVRYSSQLAMVYFFEYVVSVGAADAATHRWKDDKAYMKHHAYTMLSFAYQFGVLLSRSSIGVLRIDRIEFLTIFQAINFVAWILIAKYDLIGSTWVLDVWMVWVGLLGGAMYVNGFASLMHDPKVAAKKDGDMAVNVVNIWVNIGIMASSVCDLVLAATILKK